MSNWKTVDGGVTTPAGYRAAGVHAGIKGRNPDLALLVSDTACVVGGVFTRNRIQGATVHLCRERLAGGAARAVVINSGNANACTGPQGMADAQRMGALTAELLQIEEDSVFVCSTGTIGVPLPMAAVEQGIRLAAGALAPDGGAAAARAIMTTDTVPKETACELTVDGMTVRIGGMTKGAGMIEPNMATMLGFVTTDAAVEQAALQDCLRDAVDSSFNRITVDGDQSCNDTVLALANGQAGNRPLNEAHPDWPLFVDAFRTVCRDLAWAIVKDGEGATKFVTVTVKGARTDADALTAARKVANSLLVKTSWYGCDPNWGRVVDAVGQADVELVEERIAVFYDDVCSVKNGQVSEEPLSRLEEILRQPEFSVTVDLGVGQGSDTVYTCDCSEEYVRINSEYTT